MNRMMRAGTSVPPEKDFSFAWSLIHEMGAVPAGAAPLQHHGHSMWTMPPVSLSDKERRVNAAAILDVLCESPLLEPCLRTLLSSK